MKSVLSSMRRKLGGLLRKRMESYDGLIIGCTPGTHAELVSLISRHAENRESVVDFGAHSGALLRRLRDSGFSDLTGVDLDVTRFDVPGAAFLKLDLNADFAASFERTYDVVTATDVVEHLDSPRAFLTEARKILADDGLIAVSVPNVAFWEGRIKFLMYGELWGFGQKNYLLQRHISPTTREQMELMMREIGLEPVLSTTAGTFATPLRKILLAPLWIPFRLLCGAEAMGEASIYLARRSEPETELSQPVHYKRRWAGQKAGNAGDALAEDRAKVA